MGSTKTINQEVNVTAMYFRNRRQLKSFPKRMEYDGHEYTFVESGLRYQVKKGNRLLAFFDMNDGADSYHLRFDYNHRTWTLLSITNMLNFLN